jgi:hypothetical protein
MTKEEVARMQSSNLEEAVVIINEILSRVYNRAVEDALRQTPDLMLRLFVSMQAQQETKKDFYDRNPDFKNYLDIVQSVVQKVEAKNPDKSYEFILGLSEPMIRQQIVMMADLKKLPLDKPKEVNRDGKGIL